MPISGQVIKVCIGKVTFGTGAQLVAADVIKDGELMVCHDDRDEGKSHLLLETLLRHELRNLGSAHSDHISICKTSNDLNRFSALR
jgi:hypothetical protein